VGISATNVHEHGRLLHLGEELGVEEVHGGACLGENTYHKVSTAQMIFKFVHADDLVTAHLQVLFRGLLGLTLAANDAGAKTLLCNTAASSSNVSKANNEHGFVGTKLNRLNSPVVVSFLLRKTFKLLSVIKHSESNEFTEYGREGTLHVGKGDGACSKIGSADVSVDAGGDGVHPLETLRVFGLIVKDIKDESTVQNNHKVVGVLISERVVVFNGFADVVLVGEGSLHACAEAHNVNVGLHCE